MAPGTYVTLFRARSIIVIHHHNFNRIGDNYIVLFGDTWEHYIARIVLDIRSVLSKTMIRSTACRLATQLSWSAKFVFGSRRIFVVAIINAQTESKQEHYRKYVVIGHEQKTQKRINNQFAYSNSQTIFIVLASAIWTAAARFGRSVAHETPTQTHTHHIGRRRSIFEVVSYLYRETWTKHLFDLAVGTLPTRCVCVFVWTIYSIVAFSGRQIRVSLSVKFLRCRLTFTTLESVCQLFGCLLVLVFKWISMCWRKRAKSVGSYPLNEQHVQQFYTYSTHMYAIRQSPRWMWCDNETPARWTRIQPRDWCRPSCDPSSRTRRQRWPALLVISTTNSVASRRMAVMRPTFRWMTCIRRWCSALASSYAGELFFVGVRGCRSCAMECR